MKTIIINQVVVAIIVAFIFTAHCKPTNLEDNYGPLIDSDIQNDNENDYYDGEVEKGPDEDNSADDEYKLPLVIETASMEYEKSENETVELPCKISGTNYVQIWKKNEAILFQSSIKMAAAKNMMQLSDGSLQINNISESDEGTYTCMAMSSQKNSPEVHLHLKVKTQPKIKHIMAKNNITVLKSGDTLDLTCEASGYPKPVISWHKGSERLGTEGSNLIISNIKHREAGVYRCLADNKIGHPAHQQIEIKVEHKPFVSIEKIMVNSDEGLDTELKCIVRAEPRAQVTWKKDGVNIVNSKHTELRNKMHNHILIIKGIRESDFGVYTCSAVNALGETQENIKLVKTPAILDFIKPQKGSRDVLLSWKVQSKAPISEHDLQYRKKGDKRWEIVKPEVIDGENDIYMIKYSLKGLNAGEYETRVRSRNTHGWSEFSQVVPFEGVYKHGIHKQHKKGHNKDGKEMSVAPKHNTPTPEAMNPASNADTPAKHQENETHKHAPVEVPVEASGCSTNRSWMVLISFLVVISLLNVNRQ